jgi:PAS domain S-box-containing protein
VPLSGTLEDRRWIERLVRLRQKPLVSYSVALAAVSTATLLRLLIGGAVIEGVPFITYFPAIVITALLGGFWPGVVATLLSSLIAWYAFLPPYFSWQLTQTAAVSVLLFIFVASVNVVVVALLNMAVERILRQEKSVRVLIESAPNGILVVDHRGAISLANASIEQQFGYARQELIGRKVELLVPERQAALHKTLRESFMARPETRPMGSGRDLSGRRKDGSEFPLEIGLNHIPGSGRTAVLATVIDISERRKAQERQHFLIRELSHRTQNLLAVIQVVAARSLTDGQTIAETKAIFMGRLAALARAHAMLAEDAWEGAPLAEILNRELAAFASRLSVSGCEILVNSRAAQQFALIIHELATNSVKYGALSVPEGHISIEGKVERSAPDGLFVLRWRESGGPPVKQPSRKGFGTAILVDAAKQFGRSVELKYEPLGLSYELQVSFAAMEISQLEDPKRPETVSEATG